MGKTFIIKLWHGGSFSPNGRYVGGIAHSWNSVDPDYMSYFELISMLKEGGFRYNDSCSIYYCNPSLIKVDKDKEVLDFCKVGLDNGIVEVYITHGVDEPELVYGLENNHNEHIPSQTSTLTKSQNTTSILPIANLGVEQHVDYSDSDMDSEYVGTKDELDDLSLDGCDWIVSEGEIELSQEEDEASVDFDDECEDDSSADDEYVQSIKKLRDTKSKLIKQHEAKTSKLKANLSFSLSSGWESEYDDDNDVIPGSDLDSDNDDLAKKKDNVEVVDMNTNFKMLVWKVGMKFSSPEIFKAIVNRYAVFAGYSVRWCRSENKKKMEAKCKVGCDWKLYASWDGQKISIIGVVKKLFPLVEHRHCARHIYPPWHKKHRGDGLKNSFWKAVYAYTKADYDSAIQEMGLLSSAAVDDFNKQNPHSFCRYGFRTATRCNLVVNNLAETFNGWILEARSKPIMQMLEDIRRAVMERMFMKKTLMERANDIICPRIRNRLDKNKEYAKDCHVLASRDKDFEVLAGMEVLVVNLDSNSCTCRRWDLSGIPCSHVIACCNWLRVPCEQYVDDRLKKLKYLESYSGSIKPIRGERHWEHVDFPMHPPDIKVGAGRPRKARRKAPHERQDKPGKLNKNGIQMTCSLCKSKSHNKRTCPMNSKDKASTSSQTGNKRSTLQNKASTSTVVASISNSKTAKKSNTTPTSDATTKPNNAPKRGRGRPRKGTNTMLIEAGLSEV